MPDSGASKSAYDRGLHINIVDLLTLLFGLFLLPFNAHADSENRIEFEHLSVGHQLNGMIQDQDGFIWIATSGFGVIRYDGYDLQPWFRDQAPLSHSNALDLLEDRDGRIWIATDSGLDCYDKTTNRLIQYSHDPDDPGSIAPGAITKLAQDDRGRLWLGTRNNGLWRFNPDTSAFTRLHNDPAYPDHPAINQVEAFCQDSSGRLWIGTDRGLARYDEATDAIQYYRHDPEELSRIDNTQIMAIAEDATGNLWVGTRGQGLCRLDPDSESCKHYRHDKNVAASLGSDHIRALHVDGNGTLWVGTLAGGLNRFQPETDDFSRYRSDPSKPGCLSSNDVEAIMEDAGGVLWVMLLSGQIERYSPTNTAFTLYRHIAGDPHSLSCNIVVPIYEDLQGTIWVGTGTGGLNRFDAATETFRSYQPDPDDPRSIRYSWVSAMHEDSGGTFWISSSNLADAGLSVFDREAGLCTKRYDHDPADPGSLSDCTAIRQILSDRHDDDILWLACNEIGLDKLDRSSGQFTHYLADKSDPNSLKGGYIWDMIQDQAGLLWLATQEGLNRFDPATGVFTLYRRESGGSLSTKSNQLVCLYQDAGDNIWAGTQAGLNRFDPNTLTYGDYPGSESLRGKTVFGVMEDEQGQLWLTTNMGLIHFDPISGNQYGYTHKDGLQGDAFFYTAFCRAGSGEMWAGGFTGLNRFTPQAFTTNPYLPPVVLTSFAQSGEELSLDCALEKLDSVTLDWQSNFFEFEFASLSYRRSEKNRYRYWLEGFEDTWHQESSRRYGRYTNLPPGSYRLHLNASNNDGLWNESGVTLPVVILPPFWQTAWFKVLMACAGLALMSLIAWRIVRLKSEVVERQKVERVHLEHLHLLRGMERIDRVILQEDNVDKMLEKVIATVADIFSSDRTWLLHPCDPKSSHIKVPIEIHNPAYPGASTHGARIPVSPGLGDELQMALDSDDPVIFDPRTHITGATETAEEYAVKSMMTICLRPLIGEPWLLGLHQCSYERIWTPPEQELFKRISHHVTYAMNTVLSLRQIKESEDSLRQLSDATWEAIAIHDDGVLLQANDQYFAMFGYEPEDLLNKPAIEATTTEESRNYLNDLIARGDLGPYELTARRKSGETFPIEIRAKVMDYFGRSVRVAAIRDLTDAKRAEKQTKDLQEKLYRSRKMEAMGLMAGGVAHDLNNILTSIVAYPDLLLQTPDLPEGARKGLEIIGKAGQRATDIVADLLTIARGVAISKGPMNLNAAIQDHLKSPEHLALTRHYPDINIESHLSVDLPDIQGSRIHIKKIIMNLIGNAMEAITGTGQVTLKSEKRFIDEPLHGYDNINRGEYSVMTIADNGPGISQEDQEQIFEPFYSRKAMGRSGTGLGLAIVWNIVHDHNGYINLVSDEAGTRFEVYFPISTGKRQDPAPDQELQEQRGNGQTVLVIDDEKAPREVAADMMKHLGYSTSMVASGEEAVTYLKQNRVDLLLLDMIMDPGIDGLETYRQIIRIHPGQKAILVSGYIDTDAVKEAQTLGAGHYLKKPYSLTMLAKVVQGELSESASKR
ncbi:MAG: response regulator [bacterium]|nr:response regulator [bacterium]